MSGASSSSEYLTRLARILHAQGESPKALAREFASICAALPEPGTKQRTRPASHLRDLPHVLAHWHTDPAFLDPGGRPRPLARIGAASLATLVQRVFPRADFEIVLAALERNGAVRRVGRRFVPTARWIRFTGAEAPAHGLEALRGLLRTLDRNLASGSRTNRHFERFALNPNVPLRALGRFERRLQRQALELLFNLDAELGRLEARRRGREPTASVGVGVYFFQEPRTGDTGRPMQRGARRRGSRT